MQIKYESCILYVAQGVGVESTHEWLNTTRIYIYMNGLNCRSHI